MFAQANDILAHDNSHDVPSFEYFLCVKRPLSFAHIAIHYAVYLCP